MADYLLYQLGFDGEARDYVRRVSDGKTIELGRAPNYGQIITEVPNEALIVNVADPENLNQDVGHLDLRTGALEIVPKIDGFSYINQTFTPLDGGFFIAGHEPIFYRAGEGAFQLAEINKGTRLSDFSSPENVVSLGSGVLFTADDGLSTDIWYQGDPDTTLPVRIGETDSAGRSMFFASTIELAEGEAVGDRFVFSTVGGRASQKKVFSVGAEPGGIEELPGGDIREVSDFDSFGGAIYFAGKGPDEDSRFALWRTDGTAAGTTALTVEMLEAVSPLAGLTDDEGGIRFNSRFSDPIVVGDKMYVVLLADTITLRPPEQGGFELNPVRTMIFEISVDGTPRFASEADIPINTSLTLNNRSLGTHTAGDRILLPGTQGEIYGVDPQTGAAEQILSRIGGLYPENDLYEPYGDGDLIFLDRLGSNDLLFNDRFNSRDIVVTDGTVAGTLKVDELAIETLTLGGLEAAYGGTAVQPRNSFTSVSNDAIYWQSPYLMLLTPEAGAPAQLVFDGITDPANRDTSFTGRGLFEGPENLLEILGAARISDVPGTNGSDRLVGTSAAEIIRGLGGNDLLIGGGGKDGLDGGPDSDILIGETRGIYHTDISAQVFRMYSAVFGREPDLGGHQSWVLQLTSEAVTLDQMAAGFVASREFQQTYGDADNTQFVTLLYNNVLDRDPDTTGLNAWITNLTNGMSRAEVVRRFAESAEHVISTADDQQTFDQTRDPTEWADDVYRLFRAVFDRDPDEAGFTGWVENLSSGRFTLDQVVTQFMASPEFQATYGAADNTQFVTLLYNNVLDREPDTTGLNAWISNLDGGMSREEVVQRFMSSPEFVIGTEADLRAYIAGFGPDDVLDPGAGDAVVAGGLFADTFVFTDDAVGSLVTVTDLEVYDTLQFNGFGLSAAQILGQMAQDGDDVVFADGTEAILFVHTDLADITESMITIA